jgi:hypothetical protein
VHNCIIDWLARHNTIYRRSNTKTKLIDFGNCSISKGSFLVAVNAILLRYYWQLANSRDLYGSIDGPAGRPADNPPISDGWGVYNGTVPEWAVRVDWPSGPTIWQWFGFDLDPDPKLQSGNVATPIEGWPRLEVVASRWVVVTPDLDTVAFSCSAWCPNFSWPSHFCPKHLLVHLQATALLHATPEFNHLCILFQPLSNNLCGCHNFRFYWCT